MTATLPLNTESNVEYEMKITAKRTECVVEQVAFESKVIKLVYIIGSEEQRVSIPDPKQTPDCNLKVYSLVIANQAISSGELAVFEAAYKIEQR